MLPTFVISRCHQFTPCIGIEDNNGLTGFGTPACRFASVALVNAITGFGREILLWSKGSVTGRQSYPIRPPGRSGSAGSLARSAAPRRRARRAPRPGLSSRSDSPDAWPDSGRQNGAGQLARKTDGAYRRLLLGFRTEFSKLLESRGGEACARRSSKRWLRARSPRSP